MRRPALLALLATLLSALSAPAAADPTLTFHPLGRFFTRAEVRQGYSGDAAKALTGADLARYQARLGLETTVDFGGGLTSTARFLPQAGGFWHVGGDGLEDVALGLHEGYVRIAYGPATLDAGRFEMAYGDQLVIGPVGWHHIGRAFDGARLRVQPEPGGFWVDGFFSVITEGFEADKLTPAGTVVGNDFGAGDVYFTGIYAGLGGLLGAPVELDAYVLGRLWGATDEGGVKQDFASEITIGVRTKGRAAWFDYRAEVGVQVGNRPDGAGGTASTLAYQGDAEFGANLLGDRFRVALEGFYASGDDPTTGDQEGWNQLFPTAHKWMGYADVVGGRTNIAGGVLHLAGKPIPPLEIYVDGHGFFQLESGRGVQDGYFGMEVDAGVVWTIAKGLKTRVGYAILLPDVGDTKHFGELELLFAF